MEIELLEEKEDKKGHIFKNVTWKETFDELTKKEKFSWEGRLVGKDERTPVLEVASEKLDLQEDPFQEYVSFLELLAHGLACFKNEEDYLKADAKNALGRISKKEGPFVFLAGRVKNLRFLHHEELGEAVWRMEIEMKFGDLTASVPLEAVKYLVESLEEGNVLQGLFLLTGTLIKKDQSTQLYLA